MRYVNTGAFARHILIGAVSIVTAGTLLAGPAAASATSALLYDYEFAGTTGTVENSAPDGPAVALTLTGDWSSVPGGVQFSGNTSGEESVAYGRAAGGYTLNEPATAAVGFGTRIRYERPATGTCFSDTPNVTQIGLHSASAPSTQAKLQLSNCAISETAVMMECRFSGSMTAPDAAPVVSTLALVNNAEYNVSCVKSPDHGSKATITLSVTRISTGQTTTNTFHVPALGVLQSKNYISAGNKYPLAAPAKNTDQFNGDMTRSVYCAGTPADVSSCLAAYLPD